MPRVARVAPGGFVYHALNRAVARLPLFQKAGEYEAFQRVLVDRANQVCVLLCRKPLRGNLDCGFYAEGVTELSPGLPSEARLPWGERVGQHRSLKENRKHYRCRMSGAPSEHRTPVLRFPRVALASLGQPWAVVRNAFGVKRTAGKKWNRIIRAATVREREPCAERGLKNMPCSSNFDAKLGRNGPSPVSLRQCLNHSATS